MENDGDSRGRSTSELAAGARVGLGRFELKRQLGEGGMGIVWLAEDLHLGEDVALKFLPKEISGDSEGLQDLRDETLKSRKLTHANIVRVHDLFALEGERPFISMEFVDGPSLAQFKTAQPQRLISWDRLRPLLLDLLAALEYAHGRAVIHRDLKPANLMLDQEGRLKLADFGLAAVGESLSRTTERLRIGGTPAYMSPQQLDGVSPEPGDDIYALGATLYDLLTGKPPFYSGDVFHQLRHSIPAPIEARLKELGRENEIPTEAAEMVMSCLEKAAARRPQSAGALRARLESESQGPKELLPETRRGELLALVHTDIVGSTNLKTRLGDEEAAALIGRHHDWVRQTIARFEGEEIETAGDSFFIVFTKTSDAVRFAVTLQNETPGFAESGPAIEDRIGIHLGEVLSRYVGGSSKPRELSGLQIDLCERIMSLAASGQILMSRAAFDSARQVLKRGEWASQWQLQWLNHGPYRLDGLDESVEICEVGCEDSTTLGPPADSEKAHRHISPDAEPVLGWRPSIGAIVPDTQWTLEKRLGEGGFGEVWLVWHRRLKEARVFKFCFRADRVRSLKREVTLFRLLRDKFGEHPNIVGIQEIQLEKPPFYLIMDYARGKDLKAWCEAEGGVETIPLLTRLEIIAQTAEALHAAHQAGIVHRDVKPSNILITGEKLYPEGVRARLTDFGIGQALSQEVLSGMTQIGFTQTLAEDRGSSQTGTYMYLAPELLAGKPASPASDVYSLAVVYYQLLAEDFNQPLTPDWIDDAPDELLRDSLSPCLSGDPAQRPDDLAAFARELRLSGRRQVQRWAQESKKQRVREWWSQWLMLGSFGVFLGALFAILVSAGLDTPLTDPLEPALSENRLAIAATASALLFISALVFRSAKKGKRSNLTARLGALSLLLAFASLGRLGDAITQRSFELLNHYLIWIAATLLSVVSFLSASRQGAADGNQQRDGLSPGGAATHFELEKSRLAARSSALKRVVQSNARGVWSLCAGTAVVASLIFIVFLFSGSSALANVEASLVQSTLPSALALFLVHWRLISFNRLKRLSLRHANILACLLITGAYLALACLLVDQAWHCLRIVFSDALPMGHFFRPWAMHGLVWLSMGATALLLFLVPASRLAGLDQWLRPSMSGMRVRLLRLAGIPVEDPTATSGALRSDGRIQSPRKAAVAVAAGFLSVAAGLGFYCRHLELKFAAESDRSEFWIFAYPLGAPKLSDLDEFRWIARQRLDWEGHGSSGATEIYLSSLRQLAFSLRDPLPNALINSPSRPASVVQALSQDVRSLPAENRRQRVWAANSDAGLIAEAGRVFLADAVQRMIAGDQDGFAQRMEDVALLANLFWGCSSSSVNAERIALADASTKLTFRALNSMDFTSENLRRLQTAHESIELVEASRNVLNNDFLLGLDNLDRLRQANPWSRWTLYGSHVEESDYLKRGREALETWEDTVSGLTIPRMTALHEAVFDPEFQTDETIPSIIFENTPLFDIIEMLARQAGVETAVADSVHRYLRRWRIRTGSGPVAMSLRFENVTSGAALANTLRNNYLLACWDGPLNRVFIDYRSRIADTGGAEHIVTKQVIELPASDALPEEFGSGEVIPSLIFTDTPLADVISMLARQAGINFLFGPDVTQSGILERVISINVEDATAQETLGRVLSFNGLEIIPNPKTNISRIALREKGRSRYDYSYGQADAASSFSFARLSRRMAELEKDMESINVPWAEGSDISAPDALRRRSLGSIDLLELAQVATQQEMLIALLRLSRHRRAHGDWPDDLAGLRPANLRRKSHDYFSGRELKYQMLDADSCVLYSIGENGRDDGGNASDRRMNQGAIPLWKGWDAVWSITADGAGTKSE